MSGKQKKELAVFLASLTVCLGLMLHLALDAPSETEFRVLQFAKERGISIQAYPDCLFRLLADNPETEEFVLNYPLREETVIDLSHCDLSMGVPLLMQWDRRWGHLEYGTDMLAVSGGPAMCLSMAGYYLTGDIRFYPDRVADLARDYDWDTVGAEAGENLITQGGQMLGLQVKELAREERKVAAYLQAGSPIIALVGPGDFGDSSRFVVLTDYRDGLLSVNDPDSYANSGKTWSFAQIRRQIRALWVLQPGEG